jgi:hypothetical protein
MIASGVLHTVRQAGGSAAALFGALWRHEPCMRSRLRWSLLHPCWFVAQSLQFPAFGNRAINCSVFVI